MIEGNKRESILIVDDEPGVLEILQTALGFEGYNVLTANDTEEALNFLQAQKIGQLWIDNRLPGETGIEFVRKLREDPKRYPFAQKLRTVLISGTMKQDLKPEDRDLFDELFPKPFDLDEVINLAERLQIRP